MVHCARVQKGKKKGGGDRFSGYGTFSSAALLFPPLSPGGAHHSAANAVSERNLQQKDMSFKESRSTVQVELFFVTSD